MGEGNGRARILAVAVRRQILEQYERLAEAMGLRPGMVTLETLALLGLFTPLTRDAARSGQEWGILNTGSWGFTLLLFRGEALLFYRSKSFVRGGSGTERLLTELSPSLEYYRTRLGGGSLAFLLVRPANGAPDEETLEAVRQVTGAEVRIPDPVEVLGVPEDLSLDAASRRRLAPCLGLASANIIDRRGRRPS
jgi:Tfp pilus assembly PilM family ATPase